MNISTHQLHCFLAVARTLHFAAAARELHLSPSALSEQIKALEHHTNRALFHRTSRRVELTEPGRQLVPLAQRAIAAHDDVLAWADPPQQETLTIGLMVSHLGFRNALALAARARPEVHWQVHNIGFHGCFAALIEGRVDCVFTAHMKTKPPDGVVSYQLYSEPCVLVVPRSHPYATRSSVSMADLRDQEFIAPRTGSAGISNHRSETGTEDTSAHEAWLGGLTGRAVRHCAATFDEVVELCGAGLGVNVAAASARSTHPHPGVRFIPVDDGPTVTTYFSHRAEQANRTLEAFTRIVLSSRSESSETEPD